MKPSCKSINTEQIAQCLRQYTVVSSSHLQCFLLTLDHSVQSVASYVVVHVLRGHLEVTAARHEVNGAAALLRTQVDTEMKIEM